MSDLISAGAHEYDAQKTPLHQVIQGFGELRKNPQEFLAKGPVVLHSAPYWAMRIMVGFFLIVISGMLLGGIVASLPPLPPMPDLVRHILGVVCISAYLFLLFGFPIMGVRRFMPGRTITLAQEGVVFAERHKRVVCPWSLFRAAGQAYVTGEDRAFVPINAEAAEEVEVYRGEDRVSSGWQASTQFFWLSAKEYKYEEVMRLRGILGWFKAKLPDHEACAPHAIFPNGFLAAGHEIGMLLLELAQKMPQQH